MKKNYPGDWLPELMGVKLKPHSLGTIYLKKCTEMSTSYIHYHFCGINIFSFSLTNDSK